MADRSNYADKPDVNSGSMPQHRLAFDSNARAYTPTASELDLDGTHWSAAEDANGDWSWKPGRDNVLGVNFRTFRGVPVGAAELAAQARQQRGEHGATRYDNSAMGTMQLALAA